MLTEVQVWCDGSGVPDGPGGYGAVLCYGEARREIKGGMMIATNNRAELMAAIKALEALKRPCSVVVHTDSQYVTRAFTDNWIAGWKRKKWAKVKNVDLWKRLIEAVERHHRVRWQWVKGHAGDELNERCDEMAGECRLAIVECIKYRIDPRELPIEIEDCDYTEQVEMVLV